MQQQARARGAGRGRGRGDPRGVRGSSRGAHLRSHQETNGYRSDGSSDQAGGGLNADLAERFRGRHTTGNRGHFVSKTQSRGNTLLLNKDISKYQKDQDAISRDAEPGDWLAIPELPTSGEILLPADTKVALPVNRINRGWNTTQKYLKAHYLLLREDASSCLRDAIDKFREDPNTMDDQDLSIYDKVHIRGFTFTHKGVAARISFSTARAQRKILWQFSKRLVSGTVVALSPTSDNFRTTCIIAVVAARPIQNLENVPPEIDIFFADCEFAEIDPQIAFTMVEAKQGYYEAYRHTLLALQKLNQERFPLSDHICKLEGNIQPPDYLSNHSVRDVSAVGGEETLAALTHVDILGNWPDLPASSTLDQTQWEAMKQILTKRLAIIQGPPGTGKTYVSKIAIQTMVESRIKDDPPIIIACQTNHALDQLLIQVSEFCPEYIRLGGRSSNQEVKKRALFEVRKAERIGNIPGGMLGKSMNQLKVDTLKLRNTLSYLGDKASGLISPDILENYGIISTEQKASLDAGAARWVSTAVSNHDPMGLWLGRAPTPFRVVYERDHFASGATEAELEIEQLQEVEAEHGVADEEDLEMLKGDFVAISDDWTFPTPSESTLSSAKKALDMTDDLWKVQDHLRSPIYFIMQNKIKVEIRQRFREAAQRYMKTVKGLQVGKWERDAIYLQKASIIGVTTTGLSKYRPLIASLKPKIILIEEAAEVLEGPVAVACMESLQHLILVGDHEQLQGHCSVRELEGPPFHLNISMFERLVRANIPHKTLLSQRRMNPEFRNLLTNIYPNLRDHPSVLDRQIPPWGMNPLHRSFFMTHTYHESKDEQMSTFNEHEARLVAKFYRHLIRNGVPSTGITALTFYNGQRKRILRELRADPETNIFPIKVKTVDSYQGEENDIILLSLVRNNDLNSIGFLDIKNRACVALSRAKHGFYIFGNNEFVARNNELWGSVEDKMYSSGRVGERLPLMCVNHGTTFHVQHAEDFDDNNGGCGQKCGGRLACGHACPQKCHPYQHDKITCHMQCSRSLVCGHLCREECSEKCVCTCPVFELKLRNNMGGQTFIGVKDVGKSGNGTHSVHKQQDKTALPANTAPEQEQQTGRKLWSDYARGGAKVDDMRKAEQNPGNPMRPSEQKSLLDLSPELASRQLPTVFSQTEQQLASGRTKFVHEYQLAPQS